MTQTANTLAKKRDHRALNQLYFALGSFVRINPKIVAQANSGKDVEDFMERNTSHLAMVFRGRVHSARAALCGLQFFASNLIAAEFFVAPNGSRSGDGSMEQPWDLRTALRHPTNVLGGDTIWLRGGIYRRNDQPTLFSSQLSGEPFNPITVRQFPGERATIDGNLSQSSGGWVNYWGFEIMNSHSNRLTAESGPFPTNFTVLSGNRKVDLCVSGFDLRAHNVKLINLVVHDSIGGGVGVSAQSTNSEVNGVISFYNGWQGCDRAHGHGYYGQNRDPSFALVMNGLFFANYALGLQATSNEGLVDNFYLDSNTFFFNGSLARKHQGNFLLGPLHDYAQSPTLFNNLVYDTDGTDADVNIGYIGGANGATLLENYFQTSVHFSPSNENLFAYGNAFLGGTRFLDQTNFPGNAFETNRPENNFVRVMPNLYEPGRAHIVVFNWENRDNVAVDTFGLISEGMEIEVRNAQDFFGPPIFSGIHNGSALVLPMTNLLVTKPLGTNAPPSTAPEFNAFVVRLRETSIHWTNTAPVVSTLDDQFTQMNTPTAPVPFTLSDAETLSDFLTISVHSSNRELIPNPNIQFAGSGIERTVTIVPSANQTGTSIVTIAVSDGFLAASNVFSVIVNDTEFQPKSAGDPALASLIIDHENTVLLKILALPESGFEVQTSTNLAHWHYLGTIFTDCSGAGLLHDHLSSNYPTRFYRFQNVEEHE